MLELDKKNLSGKSFTPTVLYWLLSFFCFFQAHLTSAALLNSPEPKYLHQIWRSEDGLPNPFVRGLQQGTDGYLWLVLEDTLTRFDGLNFAEFDRKTIGNRVDRWCVGLTEAPDRSIWFSSANGGLSQLKDGKLTHYTTKDGLLDNYVLAACADRHGNIWVGTASGLCQFSNGKFISHFNAPGLITAAIRTIIEDHNGNIWIGTAKGLSCFKDNKFTSYTSENLLVNDAVMCLFEDRQGTLWIGTSDGMTHVVDGKPIHYTTKSGLLHKTVRAICEDNDGTMWIGTHGGLQRFVDGRFRPVSLKNLNDPDFEGISFVYSLCADREGNLWVGTNLGLNRLQRQKFQTITTEDGLLHNLTTLVYEDRARTIWIGTYGGGLSQIQSNSITTWTTANGLTNDFVLALCEDHDGAIWIGTDGGGVQKFKDGQFTHYSIEGDIQANSVRLIFEDSKTNLWVCSNAGAFQLINGKLMEHTNFPRTIIKTVLEDPKQSFWVGWQNGLSYITPTDKKHFTEKNGLVSSSVNTICKDKDGVLWVGTDGGLNAFKQDKWLFCPLPGLKEERILQILEDDYGRLWLGTRDGVFAAFKKELYDFIDHKTTNFNLVTFGKKDGMRRAQCNGIASPAGWKSRDGRIWFATMHGVVVFDPRQIRVNSIPPPVVIDEIIFDEKLEDKISEVKLPPGNGEVEFHFTAISFQAPEQILFKYKLEGFDSEWHDTGTRRMARYTNLRPGNYKFKVKACNADGVWNETGAMFGFILLPHFYESYWFYFLCIGVIILTVAGIHFYRIFLMRQREIELVTLVEKRTVKLQEIIKTMESFNYSIAHDLRAPLRAIKGFTNALIEDYSDSFDAIGHDYSKRIETAVDRMDKLIDDLLIFGRITHKEITLTWVNLDAMLIRIQSDLANEITRRKAKIVVRSPLPQVWANETLLQQVLTNLVSNGLKFVPSDIPPQVEVWVEETGNVAHKIYVKDNGIGIDPKHHQKIFGVFERLHSTEAYPGTGIGLAIVQKAVERMDGKVGLNSETGKGSCFWIELPKPAGSRSFQTDVFRKSTSSSAKTLPVK